jgi:pyrophosphatase PpaX
VQKREVKAILFDMDGVLVDSENAWFYMYNDALVDLGFDKISRGKFKKIFGSPIEDDLKTYFKGKTEKQLVNAYKKSFEQRKGFFELNKGVKKLLKKLRSKSLKLAVISNSTDFIVNGLLNFHGIKNYFDAVLTMEDVKNRKPNPDIIIKACKKLKVSPKESIIVGDSKYDIIAGKRAKCISVGYKIRGDYMVDTIDSIANLKGLKFRSAKWAKGVDKIND